MVEAPQYSIFTKILKKEIAGVILCTGKNCFSILTHKQAQPGHSLIIPKREVSHLEEMNGDEITEFGVLTAFISQGLKQVFQVPKVGLLRSGFELEHYHQHAIPVHAGKDISLQNVLEISIQERVAQGKVIQEALNALGKSYKGHEFHIPENTHL